MVEVPHTVVVTGVAGSGKSTVSEALAARTAAVVLDADGSVEEVVDEVLRRVARS